MDSSAKPEATWSFGPSETEKPPNDCSPMASMPLMKLSRVMREPARRRPSANSLAARKPSMLEKLGCTLLPPLPIASMNSRVIGLDALYGVGTTCETTTPAPSLPSSSASACVPTKDTL
ncbi:hypothetical protein D9M68_916420 [compost metagenome]